MSQQGPDHGKLTIGSGLLSLVAFFGSISCGDDVPPQLDGGVDTFEDYSIPAIADRAQYASFAANSGSRSHLKFVITSFQSDAERELRYIDSTFYTLHDEWYWFRLMNGARVPGEDVTPYFGEFESVFAIYEWAKDREVLPLDLRWVNDGRLYSPRFYERALSAPRGMGLGGLIFVPARTEAPVRDEIWAFELEYSDKIAHPELVIFFELLEATLPSDIASKVVWVTRSPEHQQLADQMRAGQLSYWDRVISYSDLAVQGEIEVYNKGLTAGRVRVVRAGDGFAASSSSDLLVTDTIPDYLPPAAGLITSVPQTPLAHINVLAKNRGVPNAYLGGALDDPNVDQLGRIRAPAILRANVPDELDLVPITETEYSEWNRLRSKPPASVPAVDLEGAPDTIDLSEHDLSEIEDLRPLIGGKNAGFLALLSEPSITTPDTPLAITIRPYVEHILPWARTLNTMLQLPEFRNQVRARMLILDGPARYDLRFSSADDQMFKAAVLSGHPAGSDIGDVIRAGGLADALRAQPIAPATLASLRATISTHFSALALTQGLRFRSSSTVEDIEGFNGAGLYDSNTGFLDPSLQSDPKDQARTIEWAIRKSWASYWRFEAFEERRLENVDHLSGAMALVVHPRFDDPKEEANGVMTFTVHPLGHELALELIVNMQKGAVSVTNPTTTDLPEIDRVIIDASGERTIERLRPSTLVPPGEVLLSDDELLGLLARAEPVTRNWAAERNRHLAPAQQNSTLTLDFELKRMGTGWPALASGEIRTGGLVFKQARPLEPGLRTVSEEVRAQAFPRDVLARARRVLRRDCVSDALQLTIWEAFTEELAEPDMGYARLPFVASIELLARSDVPELGLAVGERLSLEHPSFSVTDSTAIDSTEGWHVGLESDGEIRSIRVASGGELRVATSSTAVEDVSSPCDVSVAHATPVDYLQTLLDARR